MRIKREDLKPLRGFREISPDELAKKMRIIEKGRQLFRLYCYEEIEIPTVEPAALIELKSGEEIRHRMFKFKDLGGRDVVLRPEGTPSVARYVSSKLKGKPLPVRLSYVANMFRYDEPQRGRFREFMHIGFELFGSSSLLADMEIVEITSTLLSSLELNNFKLKFGHQGMHRSVLESFGVTGPLQDRVLGMIDRREEQNVLAALREVPSDLLEIMRKLASIRGSDVKGAFSEASKVIGSIPEVERRLMDFRELVDFASEITGRRVFVDFGFARGIEYYTGMIFEAYVKGLDLAVAGGGRYDGLCALFGYDIPAVGVAIGVDRLMLAEEFPQVDRPPPLATILLLDDEARQYGLRVAKELRDGDVPVLLDLSKGSLSSRLERLSKRPTNFAIFVGKREMTDGTVTVKDLATGAQQSVPLKQVVQLLRRARPSSA